MKLRILVSVLVAVVGLLATSCVAALPAEAGDADACEPDTAVDRNVAYRSVPGVAPRLLALDVYPAPADTCGQNPVLVWVHGGGWRTGDKANNVVDKIAWAHANGWTFVSVNYRLTDLSARRPVQYPIHNRDVGRAVQWVHQHIDGYGGDADQIGLMGHSAGAQIVASVAVDERYVGLATRAAVGCVAALDTEGYDVEAVIRGGGRAALLYRSTFGNRPATWRDASPINHLDPSDPPVLLTRRGTVHRQLVQVRFANALRDEGIPVTVVPLPGYSHGDVNDAVGADDQLTPALTGFYEDCLNA